MNILKKQIKTKPSKRDFHLSHLRTGLKEPSLIGLMSKIYLPPAVQLASSLTEGEFSITAYLMDGQGIIYRKYLKLGQLWNLTFKKFGILE